MADIRSELKQVEKGPDGVIPDTYSILADVEVRTLEFFLFMTNVWRYTVAR
jgi:hypothetical protein